jgi:ABC-type uncharacterized transport system permease subunit
MEESMTTSSFVIKFFFAVVGGFVAGLYIKPLMDRYGIYNWLEIPIVLFLLLGYSILLIFLIPDQL